MTSRIHTYSKDNGGLITHNASDGEDHGGEITVTGEVIPLTGWPTPAMRRAVSSIGDAYAWYVGTDAKGNIVRTN